MDLSSCGTPGLSCSFGALCAPLAPFILPGSTRNSPWCSSALSNISLTPDEAMQRNRVPILYNTASSSNLPSLSLCLARNVLGRVPLTPCFVQGNRTPTLPHSFGNHQGAVAAADSRNGAGNCSRIYEVSIWMWRYGRGSATQGYCCLGRAAAVGCHL